MIILWYEKSIISEGVAYAFGSLCKHAIDAKLIDRYLDKKNGEKEKKKWLNIAYADEVHHDFPSGWLLIRPRKR